MFKVQHRLLLRALFIVNAVVISHPLFARPNTIEYNLRAILGRRAARDISAEELRQYETVLTSDSLAGRKTTTPGMWKAATFIARQFRQFGLKPLPGADHYFFRWPIQVHHTVAPPQLAFFNGPDSLDLGWNSQFRIFSRSSNSSRDETDSLVFVGYGIYADSIGYNDFKAVSLKGKIAVFYDGEPVDSTGASRLTQSADSPYKIGRTKRHNLIKLGAAGAITLIRSAGNTDFNQKTGWVARYSSETTMSLPADTAKKSTYASLYVDAAVADSFFAAHHLNLNQLRAEIDSSGQPHSAMLPITARYRTFIQTNQDTAVNVVAMLPGKDPADSEAVMLSAHFDHLGQRDSVIYYGADDNASGTSAVLAIARAFAKAGPGRRNQIFMLVSGEEEGLLGSQSYSENPVWPLNHTVAEVNIDMIGRNAPDSIYVIGSDMLSHDLDAVVHAAARWSSGINLDYRYNTKDDPNRYYYRSDHYNFAKHDIPSVFYFAGIHEDYHQPTDTMDKLNFKKMERVTRMIYQTTRTLNTIRRRPRLYKTDATVR